MDYNDPHANSGYYIVRLVKPLPGIRWENFVFLNENEAYEFASSIHARYPDAETILDVAGQPQAIFENWSF